MNRLALGTVQFGLTYGIANQTGQISRHEAKAMLTLALAHNVDTIDTAIAYGDSEARLGEAGMQGFKVVSKLPPVPDDCIQINAWVLQQVNASITRLGVPALYGLLLHRSEQLLGSQGAELYQSLHRLKDSGCVQKIGISIYSPSDLAALSSRYRFDLVQAPFNVLDRRLHSSDWLYRLKDDEVEIHTRSVFLQGLLLIAQAKISDKFSAWHGLWQEWHRWLAEHEVSALHACLAFPLSFPEIDRVVVGADSESQLAQILSIANTQLNVDLPQLQCDDEALINPAYWT